MFLFMLETNRSVHHLKHISKFWGRLWKITVINKECLELLSWSKYRFLWNSTVQPCSDTVITVQYLASAGSQGSIKMLVCRFHLNRSTSYSNVHVKTSGQIISPGLLAVTRLQKYSECPK